VRGSTSEQNRAESLEKIFLLCIGLAVCEGIPSIRSNEREPGGFTSVGSHRLGNLRLLVSLNGTGAHLRSRRSFCPKVNLSTSTVLITSLGGTQAVSPVCLDGVNWQLAAVHSAPALLYIRLAAIVKKSKCSPRCRGSNAWNDKSGKTSSRPRARRHEQSERRTQLLSFI